MALDTGGHMATNQPLRNTPPGFVEMFALLGKSFGLLAPAVQRHGAECCKYELWLSCLHPQLDKCLTAHNLSLLEKFLHRKTK